MIARVRAGLTEESGFGLVEAILSIAVAATVLLGLAATLASGLRASRGTRLIQQATALGAQTIDASRNLDYDDLAMRDGDLSGDADVLTGNTYDPDGTGPDQPETLVSTVGGGRVDPHITTETIQNVTFTLKRYVTWVDEDEQGGPDQDYKRISAVVQWSNRGVTQSHRASTFVARTRAGLPVPKFELTPSEQSVTVEQGNQVVLAHLIRNLGIVDAYDLALPDPATRSWTITLYADVDEDGAYDAGTDTPLTDTNASGVVDTGTVATGESTFLLAVWTVPSTDVNGTETLILTATSGASNEITHEATETVTVGDAGLTLYLHDDPTPPTGDQTAEKNLGMDTAVPTGATLYRYSTDYYTTEAGRWINDKDTAADEDSAQFMANWVSQLAADTTFDGDARLRIYVAEEDLACTNTLSVKVYIRYKNSAATKVGTTLGSTTATSAPVGSGDCDFRLLDVTIPIDATVARNKWMEVKVAVNTATGNEALFAYDTTSYLSRVTLPQVVA